MSQVVERYYNTSVEAEWTRLDRHPFEFELTKRHIDQFLRPSDRILDVGGGPGKYSFHYAARGHRVTLFDLSPANLAFARAQQTELGVGLEQILQGNAVSLAPLPDAGFDFVLCMGPLYHLVDPAARSEVLDECRRALFSFVTPMAQTISLIKRNPDQLDRWEPALRHGIETGLNDTAFDTGFTEAFFTRPEAVRPFVESGGLRVLKVAGAEGIACQSEEALLNLGAEDRARWVEFLFRYSEDPSTLGANQHLVCVAEKPVD